MSLSLISRSDERARAIIEPLLALGLFPRSMPNVWTDGERIEIDLIVGHITDPQWRAVQEILRPPYATIASTVMQPAIFGCEDGMDELSTLMDRWRIPFHDEREMPF